MEEQTMETWESQIKEQLAVSDELQLLDLTQDCLIRLATTLADAKVTVRAADPADYILRDEMKRRIARVAVLMDVLQLRYGDAADEEEMYLKDIESCLE